MNRFRSRKKSLGETEARSPSLHQAPPPLPPPSRGWNFGRKKAQPAPKKEDEGLLDLATALPASDDFRTSLLLPNLSARFSMLREQDDPTTKIGKANDDSVLFPKRASRLDLFGHGDLGDIAEISSISGSVRPPFAYERSYSCSSADAYGTDDDSPSGASIMSRAKPGQGNKFFGGRQKVYKISVAGSTPNLAGMAGGAGAPSSRPMGRPVYDDDISTSTFQDLRAEEKARSSNLRDVDGDGDGDHGTDGRGSPLPTAHYNRNRETSSSTASGPFDGRTSTAATSLASQTSSVYVPGQVTGPSVAASKQSSAPDRPLNRRLYGYGLDQEMHEQQSSAMSRLNNIRGGQGYLPAGPPAAARDGQNVRDRAHVPGIISAPAGFGSAGPSPSTKTPGPTASDPGTNGGGGGGPRAAGRADDLGRPAMTSPPLTPLTPMASTADPVLLAALHANDLGKATASGAFNKPSSRYNEQQFAQRQMQLQAGRETPPPRAGSRSDVSSGRSSRLRNGSLASVQSETGGGAPPLAPIQTNGPPSAAGDAGPVLGERAADGTHPARPGGSDSSGDPTSPGTAVRRNARGRPVPEAPGTPNPNRYMHDDQHPAFRNQSADRDPDPSAGRGAASTSDEGAAGNGNGRGLNDLVRGHLRNASGASSIYPDSPPREGHPYSPGGAPRPAQEGATVPDRHVPAPLSVRAKQVLEQAHRLRNDPDVPAAGSGRADGDAPPDPWQQRKERGHTRGASTETQKEREEFANELADRRRQVEDHLKSVVESASRSSSPRRDASPFGLLKKPSRNSLGKESSTFRAMKKLGLGPAGTSHNDVADERPEEAADGRVSRAGNPQNARADRSKSPSFRDHGLGADVQERLVGKRGKSPSPRPADGERSFSDVRKQFSNPNGFVPRNFSEPVGASQSQQQHYHPAGRARHYSPPRTAKGATTTSPTGKEATDRPNPAPELRTNRGRPSAASAGRTGPASGAMASASNSTTSLLLAPAADDTGPQMITPGTFPAPAIRGGTASKRSVSKLEISTPTFLSATSSVDMVDLPPGASLENGMEEVRALAAAPAAAPPVPPINPRRRQNGFGFSRAMKHAVHSGDASRSSLDRSSGEQAGSPVEEEPERFKSRAFLLRKTNSEGGSLAAKARHQAMRRDMESMPTSPIASQETGRGPAF